jgi:hypothetical protein
MNTSGQFTHVPFIGYKNVVRVKDNATGLTQKFIASLDAASPFVSEWVPRSSGGDEGNIVPGGPGVVPSYTDTEPEGRAGNMITYMHLLGEGPGTDPADDANFIVMVAIPSGMAPGATSPLLDKKYSLSNQPPAESFDYSKFLPIVEAWGCLSLFGGGVPGSSGSGLTPIGPTGRFPTVPSLPPFMDGVGGTLFYLPPGFYGNINTILNDMFGVAGQFNVTLLDQPQYGILCISAQWLGEVVGSGCLTIDFSHSIAN